MTFDEQQSKSEQTDQSVEIGNTLDGRYRIVGTLGRGGMGSVFEALDLSTGISVAVKVMRSRDNYLQQRGRFLREARIEGALSHPNIIDVLRFGETQDGRLYIVTELLRGETLGRALLRRETLPSEDAVYIGIQVLRALEVAHAADVVHRDLKPDNIYLTHEGGVKVLDFGMVKLLNREDSIGPLTRTGTIGGTPQYIAPEMAQGHSVDGRTDLYALGVLLFEMLAGHPPFDGKTPVDVLLKHIKLPVPDLDAPRTDVPEALVGVIQRALTKAPKERLQSAQEFRTLLEEIAAGLPVPERTLVGHIESTDSVFDEQNCESELTRVMPSVLVREDARDTDSAPSIELEVARATQTIDAIHIQTPHGGRTLSDTEQEAELIPLSDLSNEIAVGDLSRPLTDTVEDLSDADDTVEYIEEQGGDGENTTSDIVVSSDLVTDYEVTSVEGDIESTNHNQPLIGGQRPLTAPEVTDSDGLDSVSDATQTDTAASEPLGGSEKRGSASSSRKIITGVVILVIASAIAYFWSSSV
jgi:serine/threonine-protein kinase